MSTVLIALGYFIIVIFDTIPLFRNGKKKEKILYTLMLIVSFLISILLSLDVNIPSSIPLYKKIIMTLRQGVL